MPGGRRLATRGPKQSPNNANRALKRQDMFEPVTALGTPR